MLTRKTRPVFDDDLHCTFHRLWQRNTPYMFFYWQNLPLFFTYFEWEGRIPYAIVDSGPEPGWPPQDGTTPALAVLLNLHPSPPTIKWRIKSLLYRLAGQAGRGGDSTCNLLACPVCHGPVQLGPTQATCSLCRVNYPVCNGIPVLLASAATPAYPTRAGQPLLRSRRLQMRLRLSSRCGNLAFSTLSTCSPPASPEPKLWR